MSYFSSKQLGLGDIRPIKVTILYLVATSSWILARQNLPGILLDPTGLHFILSGTFINGFFLFFTALGLFLGTRRQLSHQMNVKLQYKSLFLSNPAPMWIFDVRTFQILEVNDAAVLVYEYSAIEFKRLTILDIVVLEDQANARVDTVKIMESNSSFSFRHRHKKKDGSIISAKVTSHRTHFQNRNCILVVSENVTPEELQENALKLLREAEEVYKKELELTIVELKQTLEEKARLAEVIDRIHNMAVITDAAGIIIWVNQAFVSITGYGFEEAVGRTTEFLDGPMTDQAVRAEVTESIKKEEFSTFEIINYSKSGQGYWAEVTISPIKNGENEVARYISIHNIITARKLRDFQIMEQNEVLKKLAWTNSHAVRKPIASIMGLIELGRDVADLNELKELHELIERCSIELDEITKEVNMETSTGKFDGFSTL
jgi:PAS domain S-box-containing protein